jgi:hypothetical protein
MERLIEKISFIERKNSTLTQDDKALLVKFRLMGAEEKNENDRIYPRGVLAKAVEDLRGRLAKRKSSFALNGHKDDENVDDVAAVLEDIEMTGKDVWAVARVLPTQRGRNVQAIIRAGGAVGVSAKCYGSVKDGLVQPGLVLKGFDFCLQPGFGTYATASNIIESVEVPDELDGATTLEELEKYGLEPLEPIKEEIVKQRYRFAIEAGYKGSFEQYSKDVLKKS